MMSGLEEPYLVIGSKGMLGTDLMDALRRAGLQARGMDLDEVDISRADSVTTALSQCRPGTVINVAAFTDVDGCESREDLAFRVNAQGPGHLAHACRDRGCTLVHISTDYVFDGLAQHPYGEDHPMNPMGVYGKSKAEGEMRVRELLPDSHAIVRTAWLFGLKGKNFVATMLDLGRKLDVLRVVDDQRGAPTYTRDLAAALVKLCRKEGRGTFHVTNSGETTWYAFAKRIMAKSGLEAVRVEPITTAQLGRPAPRPAYSLLNCAKYTSLTGHRMRSWEEALDDYLGEVGQKHQVQRDKGS
jgi:dTDP-4-dehydrorhamnose reductase